MDAFIFICLILLAIVLVMTKEYVDSRRFMERDRKSTRLNSSH